MDARSNIITVPILSKDIDGFYTPPSQALIVALQTYLDARKEVTQSVVVSSGVSSLIYAALKVRLGIDPAFDLPTVQSDVTAKIDLILKDRKFGKSLFVKELYDAIDTVAGVKFSNVKITGFTGSLGNLDTDGNLIASQTGIITKDKTNFVITTELYKE
jgi:uncharacterized phage protein gp47/JayE